MSVPLASEADLPLHQLVDNNTLQSPLNGQGRVLLIAEDHTDIRDMLTTALENHGFRVVSYADGQALIEHLNTRSQPWPDLILTDLQMPIADGFAVLACARRQTPPLPVVLLSATPPTQGSGFDASLLKPISIALLLHTLDQLLNLHPDTPTEAALPSVASLPVSTPTSSPAPPPCTPPAAVLAELTAWVEWGAISDLADWGEQCAVEHPEWAPFAKQISEAANQADLGGLRALLRHTATN